MSVYGYVKRAVISSYLLLMTKMFLLTSSIIGPKASLSITLCPVDDTSAFCTSSSLAAAAFSVNVTDLKKKKKTLKGRQRKAYLIHPHKTNPHNYEEI